HAGRVRCLGRCGAEELLCRLRQGSARRQEADRSGAGRQVTRSGAAVDTAARFASGTVNMDLFVRGITLISKICGVVAALLIAVAVVVVCHMVFVRSVLNQN